MNSSERRVAIVPEAPKDPWSYSMLTYVWVVLWASAGGIASFISKVRSGQARWCNLAELAGEIFIAGFVGLMTFWLCEWAEIDGRLSAVLIAISGHMGSRALFAGERLTMRYLEARLGLKAGDVNAEPPAK